MTMMKRGKTTRRYGLPSITLDGTSVLAQLARNNVECRTLYVPELSDSVPTPLWGRFFVLCATCMGRIDKVVGELET